MVDTDLETLEKATANMTAAQTEEYMKAQLSWEATQEQVISNEESPQTKLEEKTEEVQPESKKDKAVQMKKISFAQTKMWKERALKAEAEKADYFKKLQSGEVKNTPEAQSDYIKKIVEAELAKHNIVSSQDTERNEFIKEHSAEIDLMPHYEEIIKENPTLSLEQARILYLADNAPEKVYDPAIENRKRLAKQAITGNSVSSEEKSLESLTSDEILKFGKAWVASGKISKTF